MNVRRPCAEKCVQPSPTVTVSARLNVSIDRGTMPLHSYDLQTAISDHSAILEISEILLTAGDCCHPPSTVGPSTDYELVKAAVLIMVSAIDNQNCALIDVLHNNSIVINSSCPLL